MNGRPPSSLEVDCVLFSAAGAFLLLAPARAATGLGVGGALGGGGGGAGTPTGGGGGGGGAPPLALPLTVGGAGGGGAPFATGSGGGGRAAAASPSVSSFLGSGGTFVFAFGCLMGKSSYSIIFFFGFLFDERGGSTTLGGGEGLLGFGGRGGSGFSAS